MSLMIYLIRARFEPSGEYMFEEAVVAAKSIKDAKNIHPSGEDDLYWNSSTRQWDGVENASFFDTTWVGPHEVVAEPLGSAYESVERGVLLARDTHIHEEEEEEEDNCKDVYAYHHPRDLE